MENIISYITNNISNITNNITNINIFNYNVIGAILTLLAIVYGGLIAPELPLWLANILSNKVIKIIILIIIITSRKISPILALLLSLCFIISMQSINRHSIQQLTENVIQINKLNNTNDTNNADANNTNNADNADNTDTILTKNIPPYAFNQFNYSFFELEPKENNLLKEYEDLNKQFSEFADDNDVSHYGQFRESSTTNDLLRY